MVNAVRNLTRMGADVRQIAKLLQAKAPPGHKLAYINDEEAKLLKKRGGSGRITKEGIPSYEDGTEGEPYLTGGAGPGPATETAPAPSQPITSDFSGGGNEPYSTAGAGPSVSSQPDLSPLQPQTITPQPSIPNIDVGLANQGAQSFADTEVNPTDARLAAGTQVSPLESAPPTPKAPPPPPEAPMSDRTKAALGIGGLQAILGAQQIKKAQAGANAPSAALAALGAPQQQLGAQEMAQAQRGELTAGNQAAIQAARAQLGQGIANRGGVGVAQAVNQITSLTNQALQQQYSQGSKDLAAGNQYAASAIQLGVQQDQYIQSMTANYVANLARTVASLYGATPQTNETKPNVPAP